MTRRETSPPADARSSNAELDPATRLQLRPRVIRIERASAMKSFVAPSRCTERRAKTVGEHPEQPVAGLLAEGGVDFTEAIDVQT